MKKEGNNVKVSYSRAKNVKIIITNYNETIVNRGKTSNKKNVTVLIKTHAHYFL